AGQGAVASDDLTGDRRIHIGGGLDRLHHRAGLTGLQRAAHFGHFHKHQVAERMLGVVGNSNFNRAVGEGAQPLVSLGVLQIGGYLAHRTSPENLCYLTSAWPNRTNSGFTTRAFKSLPRMSTCTCGPEAAGTRANAIERSKVGENVPLVVSPSSWPGTTTF